MTCRIFVAQDQLRGGELEIDGDEHHYLHRVRRVRLGDEITVFDGAGRQASARIDRVSDDSTLISMTEPVEVSPPAPGIRVLLPLMKGDAFDSCLSKLVELGVSQIAPIRTARCVVRVPSDKLAARLLRYRARAKAAARQSRNPHVPDIEPIADLADALDATDAELSLVPWERATRPLADALAGQSPTSIALLFGPEGGLETAEVDAATAAGFAPVSLGPRILRAETAPIAVAAILRFTFGDIA